MDEGTDAKDILENRLLPLRRGRLYLLMEHWTATLLQRSGNFVVVFWWQYFFNSFWAEYCFAVDISDRTVIGKVRSEGSSQFKIWQQMFQMWN